MIKSDLGKSGIDSKPRSLVRYFATIVSVGLIVHILYLQLFLGFINFGLTDIDSGDGASFDQILQYQKAESRVDKDSTIFSIRQNELITSIQIGDDLPKFLAFNLNYLSTDDIRLKVSFQSNSSELAQDYLKISQGIQHYKIPNVGDFDSIEITSLNQGLTKMGVNGISTLSQLGVNKVGLLLSIISMGLYVLLTRFRMVQRFSKDVNSLQVPFGHFKEFLIVNRYGLVGLIFIAVGGYGFFATNFTLSLDEELFWMMKDGSAWVGYGRFGNYFLDKYLTFDSSVIPYFTDFFAVTLLLFSSVIFLFSWARERVGLKIQTFHFIIAGGLFLTFPFVNADFMAFSVYNLWLSIGFILTGVSVVLTRSAVRGIFNLNSLLVVVFMTTALSIYQSFISAYLVIYALLELSKVLEGRKTSVIRPWLQPALLLTLAAIFYLVMNSLAQRYITAGYGYIGMLVGWNDETSPLTTLKVTLSSIFSIYVGKYGSSGRILTLLVVLVLVKILTACFATRSLTQGCKIAFSSLIMILAPFAVVILVGNMLPARSLVGLPLLLGGIWLILITNLSKVNLQHFLALTGFILLVFQLQFLNSIFYGDYLRYQNDLYTGRGIVTQIQSLGFNYREYPIVFVGQKSLESTKLVSSINSGGRSFFDDASQSYRMTYFLRTIGYSVLLPTPEESERANANQPTQSWPEKGSVSFDGAVIIVKLSS
jgi:hypothetical protein